MMDGHTTLYGFIAHPAAHSLSPLIHNTSFRALGINAAYLTFDINTDTLEAMVAAIRAMGIGGMNLSLPLKTDVIPLLDAVTPRAKRLNAVNTIINRDGQLTGDTTDGQGFVDALEYQGIQIAGKRLTILGAGGAGRSIIGAAIDAGVAHIGVFKRQNATFADRKRQLESWSDKVSVLPYDDEQAMVQSVSDSQIVVNTTNVGMAHDQAMPVSQAVMAAITPQHIIFDAIYFPLVTPFLAAAKIKGAQTFNGIGMLVQQAAGSFFEWTGQKMPIDQVMAAVNEAVASRQTN